MGKNQTNGTGLTLALIPAHTFIFHLQYDGFRMAVLLSCPVFLSVSEAPISSIRARNRVLYSVRFFSLLPLVACHRRGPRRFFLSSITGTVLTYAK
jgi:hypothetical protein